MGVDVMVDREPGGCVRRHWLEGGVVWSRRRGSVGRVIVVLEKVRTTGNFVCSEEATWREARCSTFRHAFTNEDAWRSRWCCIAMDAQCELERMLLRVCNGTKGRRTRVAVRRYGTKSAR